MQRGADQLKIGKQQLFQNLIRLLRTPGLSVYLRLLSLSLRVVSGKICEILLRLLILFLPEIKAVQLIRRPVPDVITATLQRLAVTA